MQYGIITTGSRGDVQPFVALAIGLKERGHDVVLLASQNFREFIEGFGITFIPLAGDGETIIQSPEALKILNGGNIIKFFYHLQKVSENVVDQCNQDILEGCKNLDYLIASVLPFPIVFSIAEKFNKKLAVVYLSMPNTPTSEFPFQAFASFNHRWFNRISYKFVLLGWLIIKKQTNAFRKKLGLPLSNVWKKYLRSDTLTIYPMSQELLRQPKDWPPNAHVTGFLRLPTQLRSTHPMDQPSAELLAWLAEGDKPIYVGFGSIPIPDPTRFSIVLNELLTQTNNRIIFCLGWSLVPDLPKHPNLFVSKYANHDWLFPKCKMAIIHGGIGTIGAAMTAGIPMIVISVLADQPHNGKMIADRNLGVHIPFKKLTTKKLVSAIEMLASDKISAHAAEVGVSLRKDDGVAQAIPIIEDYFLSGKGLK